MKKIVLALTSSLCFVGAALAKESGGGNKGINSDFTTGVVFPSMNSAIFENPSGLKELSQRRIELGFFRGAGGFSGGNGSVVAKTGPVGWGADLRRVNSSTDQVRAGIGFPLVGNSALGIGYGYGFGSGSLGFSAGLRSAISGKMVVGLFFESLENFPGNWTLGFGSPVTSQVNFGFDFEFMGASGSFEPQQIQVVPCLVFSAEKKISVKIGFDFGVYPNVDLALGTPALGISYWPNDKIGIFFNWNERGLVGADTYVFGLKLL